MSLFHFYYKIVFHSLLISFANQDNLPLRMLLIPWWAFFFVKCKGFILSSEITLDKTILLSVRKYFLKTQIHNTQKNNVYISDALFNIFKPIKFYITFSVRKETISHLTMDIDVTFYAIICVNEHLKNMHKMLVTWTFLLVLPFSQF